MYCRTILHIGLLNQAIKLSILLLPLQPARIRDYKIQSELGHGSFGVVYKVKNKNGEICALKEVKVDRDPRKQKYKEGEIDVIKKDLQHDNIVKVYEFFIHQGTVYISMELCEGGDLNEYFIKNRPGIKERYEFMVDTARGLNYLHNQEIIHRDIKPENVLLKHNGDRFVCKISDFGIARIKLDRHDTFNTYIGSPAYIPPEMQDGSEYSNSVDVFSLGLLFFAVYNCTILKNYFGEEALIPGSLNAKGSIEFLNGKLRKDRPDEATFLSTYFKDSDSNLGSLIYSMLKSTPEERPNLEIVLIQTVQLQVHSQYRDTLAEKEEMFANMRSSQRALQNEKNQLTQRNRALEAELERKESEKRSIQNENRAIQNERQEVSDRNRHLQQQLLELEEQLSDVKRNKVVTLLKTISINGLRYRFMGGHTYLN